MILLVASSPQELQGFDLLDPWREDGSPSPQGETQAMDATVIRRTFFGASIVAVSVGVGKISSALGTYAAIQRWRPSHVIGIGTCGAVRDDLAIGDTLIASSVVQYDIDLRRFKLKRGETPAADGGTVGSLTTDLSWIPKEKRTERLFFDRIIGTADRFLVEEERMKSPYLIDELHIDAVDMESYAMLAAAKSAGVPCGIIRTVSDTTHGARPRSYGRFLAAASSRMVHLAILLVQS